MFGSDGHVKLASFYLSKDMAQTDVRSILWNSRLHDPRSDSI